LTSSNHAKSTASLFSVIASARLHGIEPEEYLRCLIRLVPLWPSTACSSWLRCFGRAPASGSTLTRLLRSLGPIAIPAEPLDTTSKPPQQATG